jgi:hypothetical protein
MHHGTLNAWRNLMGRRASVDTHPQREAIIKALIGGKTSYRIIAERFNIPFSCIHGYMKERLLPVVAKAKEKQDEKEGDAFLRRIETTMVRVQKMYDACDEWLTDPDTPSKYTLSERSDEILVIYTEIEPMGDGEPRAVRKKDSLESLLKRIEDGSTRTVMGCDSRRSDPRKLILETALVLNKQLELLAKIQGLVKDNLNVTINAESIYTNIVQVISNATKEFPDIRERIIGELEKSTKSITG